MIPGIDWFMLYIFFTIQKLLFRTIFEFRRKPTKIKFDYGCFILRKSNKLTIRYFN